MNSKVFKHKDAGYREKLTPVSGFRIRKAAAGGGLVLMDWLMEQEAGKRFRIEEFI